MPYERPPSPRERLLSPTLGSAEERLKARNERIAALRERSGLSMDELAREMGFKGQSSIQRYLSPSYDKGFRPEISARFKAALVGRGQPPIQPGELGVFDNWAETSDGKTLDMIQMIVENFDAGRTTKDFYDQLESLGLPRDRNDVASVLANLARIKAVGGEDPRVRVAGLPLLEGNVLLRMPKQLSEESAETLRDWLNHLINLAKVPDGSSTS